MQSIISIAGGLRISNPADLYVYRNQSPEYGHATLARVVHGIDNHFFYRHVMPLPLDRWRFSWGNGKVPAA